MPLTPKMIRVVAVRMLAEMACMRLSVAKIQTDTGYVRVVISHNPPWYQWLCGQWIGLRGQRGGRHKRSRTIIRRKQTVRCLEKLTKTPLMDGVYAERLRSAVEWYVETFGNPLNEPKQKHSRRRRVREEAPF
jgi:hypothetical protein